MAELKIHRKTFDLDEMPSLDEDTYLGVLRFARQWDDPQQELWVAQIEKARGNDVEEPQGWDRFTADELRDLLEANDLPVSGKKSVMIEKLTEAGVEMPA